MQSFSPETVTPAWRNVPCYWATLGANVYHHEVVLVTVQLGGKTEAQHSVYLNDLNLTSQMTGIYLHCTGLGKSVIATNCIFVLQQTQ